MYEVYLLCDGRWKRILSTNVKSVARRCINDSIESYGEENVDYDLGE